MQHVRVTMTAAGREAEIHPMYDLLANAAFVERATAMNWNFTGDALGILHYVEGDLDAFDDAVAAVDPVVAYELEPAGDDGFYAYVRDELTEASRKLFAPLTYAEVVVVPPVVYRADGSARLSMFGPSDVVQAMLEAVPSPVELTVESVGGLGGIPMLAETRLSDRQREAVAAGLALGYYEVPRTAGQEAVADALDCAPSTAAEHLRKAEAKLVRAVVTG